MVSRSCNKFFVREDRDVGFMILPGNKLQEKVEEWLEGFQRKEYRVLGCNKLQFTATLWWMNKPGGNSSGGKVVTCTDSVFPYLYMALFWSLNGNLHFSIYCKPNQQLKYLNLGNSSWSCS